MRRLIAVAVPAGPRFVEVLRRCWDAGDALAPIDPQMPRPALTALLERLRPAALVDATGTQTLADPVPVEDGDALVVATSGATASPKGVVLTHDAVSASARMTSTALGVDPTADRWLACLPLWHIGGLSVLTRAVLTGTPVEVIDRIEPAALTGAVTRGATLVSLVPAVLSRVDVGPFRVVLLGGSAIPEQRPANTVATYGMTETGSGIVYDGRPLGGVELRIVDDEIHVRSPTLLRCYRDGSDPRTSDGWLPTADLGRIEPDGRLRVLGRRGDRITTGGNKVWPNAVEQVLQRHPQVAAVAVVGRADRQWGEVVTAVVVPVDPNDPPTVDALRGWAAEQLPSYMAPRRLEVVERLPLTASGKVRRSAL